MRVAPQRIRTRYLECSLFAKCTIVAVVDAARRMNSHIPVHLAYAVGAYISSSPCTYLGSSMACFIAPLIAGGVVAALRALARELGEKLKLDVLSAVLWGGTVLLVVEHAWHGEVVPYPPFLTAMADPAEAAVAIREIATSGLTMVATSLSLWGGILSFDRLLVKKIAFTKTLK
ncbi:MAG: hypothetical protein N3H31_07810 [Candidatus Nezhaarchaeota archaeon]|nr:hypothetical protein [Candidatus Nezhaarchaeota archaeon]